MTGMQTSNFTLLQNKMIFELVFQNQRICTLFELFFQYYYFSNFFSKNKRFGAHLELFENRFLSKTMFGDIEETLYLCALNEQW
jgi:hypothetical protein